MNKCLGCGVALQINNIETAGFVDDINKPYCKNCFLIKNYGKSDAVFAPNVNLSFPTNAILINVVSILNLDQLWIRNISKYAENARVIYIINQLDLLPKSTNLDLFLVNIENNFKKLKITYHEIIFMSAKSNNDLANLKNYLYQFKKQNIYLLGVANSGKTTIFKGLTNDQNPIASLKIGQTLDNIHSIFSDNNLYDMPGFNFSGRICDYFPYEIYKKLIPSKRMNPRIYQLKQTQALIINNIIGISLISADANLVLYFSNNLEVKKVNERNVLKILNQNNKDFLFKTTDYKNKLYKRTQINFADIGFIHILGEFTIKITVLHKYHITLMESLFK